MVVWIVMRAFERLYGVEITGDVLPVFWTFGLLELLIEIFLVIAMVIIPIIVFITGAGRNDR